MKIERARFGVTWGQTGDSESRAARTLNVYDSGRKSFEEGNLDATSGILWDDGKMWKPAGR